MKDTNQIGILTDVAQKKAVAFLGEEITQIELRLYPYLDYCWKNGGYVDRSRLSKEEKDIIINREKQGYLRRQYGGYNTPSRAFYDFVQDMLAETYVVMMEDEDFYENSDD